MNATSATLRMQAPCALVSLVLPWPRSLRATARSSAIPGIPRLIASMLLARIAGQMTSLILVLFALDRYGSPAVAGAAPFLPALPGLGGSPLARAVPRPPRRRG